ncbi:MAG: hypothetical protein ABWX58_06970, partial [Psychrobacillus psychrotolerans]
MKYRVEESAEPNGLLANEYKMYSVFQLLKANVFRSRTTLSIILLKIDNQLTSINNDVERDVSQFLQSKIRGSDIIVKLSAPSEWCIFLSPSGEEEAIAFIQRLFNSAKDKDNMLFQSNDISLSAVIAEIGNSRAALDEVFQNGRDLLLNEQELWAIKYVSKFKEKDVEKVRVSIIEDDNIFQKVLQLALFKLPIKQFNLEIKTFSDGYEFLKSDWYRSSHTHLIIMNDILPKKKGLVVLNALNNLPNHKRFIT